MFKSKGLIVGGICVGIILAMAYHHRGMIKAAIKGEEMPEPPKGCPFCKKQSEE